jgi:16S rRNA A1518/A1519 N6-dimethyltransferase RsmA/KsgA/DIM1 with predicted DNA glycosylase/AP lyase activity
MLSVWFAFIAIGLMIISILTILYYIVMGIVGVPWVRTSNKIAEKMCQIANVRPGETVVDFGSGTGSLLFCATTKFRAHGIGIEARFLLVVMSYIKKTIRRNDRIVFICGDMFKTHHPYADVIAVYLFDSVNAKLEPLLIQNYSSGTRVVSRVFQFKKLTFIKKDIICDDIIYLYQIP